MWGHWTGRTRGSNAPKPIYTAFDRGGVIDLTERRPAVPELRLADMDRDGIHTHVIFGPVTSVKTKDQEFTDELHRVYNDWLGDFCKVAPTRLSACRCCPRIPNPPRREVVRLGKRGGVKQANLQIAAANPRLHDPALGSRCGTRSRRPASCSPGMSPCSSRKKAIRRAASSPATSRI